MNKTSTLEPRNIQQLDEGSTPDDEQQMALADRAEKLDIVQKLGDALCAKRKEAQDARTATGIEQDWKEDEEFYQAIDSANPEGESHVGKPVSPDGGPIGITAKAGNGRSTVFIPITRAYVDAASARVGDMLLPTDDSPWSIKPTPVTGNEKPSQPMAAPMQPPMEQSPMAMAAGAQPPAGPMAAMPAAEEPPDDEAKAKRAAKVIEDWHIECQWHAEVRKVIEDAALLGTGVLKGPFPMVKVSQKYQIDPQTGQGKMVRVTEIKPVSKRVHPRNFWCDPAAGEDVQNGSYTWEFDQISARTLRQLKENTAYIGESIDQVLKEGPNKEAARKGEGSEHRVDIGAMYPIWYFYGDIDRETLIAAGIPEGDFGDEGDVAIPAVITMVNDTVIMAALNPLENGGFPYDVMPWQRRSGMIHGKGVARQIRTPQRMLNAGVRATMDNAGLTSGPIWAIRDKWIKPIDGQNVLTPRKGFRMTEDAPPSAKITDAISFTNIQSAVNELELVIQKALKFAEDATGLPMLMQGQQGSAPDTVGGMTILNNNGSTVLRRIARTFDDNVTERHIRRYYFWLIENPGNDDAKGDFQIDARGSTALVERDLQNQALNSLAPMLMQHPDIHVGRLAEELLKANRLDPKRVMLTEQEKQERASQQPPPPLPLMLAKMNNESREKMHVQKLQFEQGKTERELTIDEGKLKMDYEGMLGELALKKDISVDQVKAMLASVTMKLNTQVALSDTGNAKQLLTPPSEPAGRAPAGQAYAK